MDIQYVKVFFRSGSVERFEKLQGAAVEADGRSIKQRLRNLLFQVTVDLRHPFGVFAAPDAVQVRFVAGAEKVDAELFAVSVVALPGKGGHGDAPVVEFPDDFGIALPPADRPERRFGQQVQRDGLPFTGARRMARSSAAPEMVDRKHIAESLQLQRLRHGVGKRLHRRGFAVLVNRRDAVVEGVAGRQRIDGGFRDAGRKLTDPLGLAGSRI